MTLERQDTGSEETVLLVEDNEMVRRSMEAILSTLGYRVFAVGSAETAIDFLESQAKEIDLLISDMVLPEMDGQVLIRRARELVPELPVLFMSGYDLSLAGAKEEVTFLQKPFDAHDLATAVRQALLRS